MDDRTNDVLREFLGEQLPASELRAMRRALEDRLKRLRAEAETDARTADTLRPRIEQLEKQVRALAEEEAISGFVEESVRASVADLGPVSPDSAPHEASIPPWAAIDIDDVPEE